LKTRPFCAFCVSRAQAHRCDTPRPGAYATWERRAGTLTTCSDLFHHPDLEIALGKQLLQPRIPDLELPQVPALHITVTRLGEFATQDQHREYSLQNR
jgi:hypothetical protein